MNATATAATPAPLIDRLVTELAYPLVDTDNLDEIASSTECLVLFFTEDPKRFPETNDVAVVLPELVKAFPRLTPAVVARGDEKILQNRYGFTSWPALVFLRRGGYLGVITGIQDWQVYLQRITRLLDSEPTRPPTLGIPVVGRQ